MSKTYRAIVKAKAGKTVEIDGGHRGKFTLGKQERPIASDLLGLALYALAVNHEDIEVTPVDGSPTNPEAPKKSAKVTPIESAKLKKEDGK